MSNKTAKQIQYSTRIGQLPTPLEVIPTTFTGIALSSLSIISGAALSSALLNVSPLASLAVGFGTATLITLGRSLETAQQRRGCVLKQSEFIIKEVEENDTQPTKKNIDIEATQALQKATKNLNLFIEIKYSSQYRLLIVRNDNPYALSNNRVMGAMAIHSGADLDEVKFIAVIKKGQSAFLIPRPEKDWVDTAIPYTKEFRKKGELIGFIGYDVFNQPITYNRRLIPHALFAGQTGSGKTEAMRVDIQSMLDSDTTPIIYIFDPKEDMADIANKIKPTGGRYVEDIKTGIELLETLANEAVARKARYSQQGVKNIWEYRRKISVSDTDSRPVFIYADEIALIFKGVPAENKTYTDPETGEDIIGWADRAKQVIGDITRRDRAAGLFFSGGIQRPDAKIIEGELKSNVGLTLAFSHVNSISSRVTIDSSIASGLPLMGGVAVRKAGSKKITLGRGAYTG